MNCVSGLTSTAHIAAYASAAAAHVTPGRRASASSGAGTRRPRLVSTLTIASAIPIANHRNSSTQRQAGDPAVRVPRGLLVEQVERAQPRRRQPERAEQRELAAPVGDAREREREQRQRGVERHLDGEAPGGDQPARGGLVE